MSLLLQRATREATALAFDLAAPMRAKRVLITGACEDVSSNDPPSGLQLLLGTATQPHRTDTLVMSNLGYFQLKAAPGV